MSENLSLKQLDTKISQIESINVSEINSKLDDLSSQSALIKAKTDTITADLFTATHASMLDANISSRALETTAQAIKAKTDLLSAGALSGNVKSIQKGQLLGASTYAGTGSDLSYVDVPISSVNISKCVIFVEIGFGNNHTVASTVSGTYSTSVNGTYTTTTYRGLARLISSTTLRIHNSAATASTVHGSWTIVEYY